MDDVKRLGFPVLVIVVSAVLTKLIETYLTGAFVSTLLIIVTVSALFMFGVSLNRNRKKKSNAIFRKVFAVVVVVLLLFTQLGYFRIPYVSDWMAYLGMAAFYINMLYIFCGYLFVD